MQKQTTVINIGKLWHSQEGTVVNLYLDLPIKFNKQEIDATTNFVSRIDLIKLKDEISVIIKDANITINIKCERCSSIFSYKINIPIAEREFLYKKRETKTTDENETFQINTEKMTIDLYEMIRQEIILHFPLIAVCSKSCKGLCPKCGQNKNEKECNCKIEEHPEMQKPFENLADLIKKST